MQIAAGEAGALRELIMSCMNTITNMAYFLKHVQDPELKSILEKHFPVHVQDYNMKVEYITRPQGPGFKLPVPDLTQTLQSYTQAPVQKYATGTPRTDVQDFNDQEMATAYLLTLKRAGREYASSAMEASTPVVRTFLEDAFRMASHHAFEVWQWMVKKGYYPVEAASPQTLNTISQIYQVVGEPSMASR